MLEINVSPDSKFVIQMSPGKGEKLPSLKPSKKGKKVKKGSKKEPKVKILDHGLLDVPLIDNAIGLASAFFKLPKYVPKANMADMDDDNKSSPKKSDAAVDEEDLRVYDQS